MVSPIDDAVSIGWCKSYMGARIKVQMGPGGPWWHSELEPHLRGCSPQTDGRGGDYSSYLCGSVSTVSTFSRCVSQKKRKIVCPPPAWNTVLSAHLFRAEYAGFLVGVTDGPYFWCFTIRNQIKWMLKSDGHSTYMSILLEKRKKCARK